MTSTLGVARPVPSSVALLSDEQHGVALVLVDVGDVAENHGRPLAPAALPGDGQDVGASVVREGGAGAAQHPVWGQVVGVRDRGLERGPQDDVLQSGAVEPAAQLGPAGPLAGALDVV